MGGGAEPKSRPSRLAFHHRQCPHETETFVSKDSCLTEYYLSLDWWYTQLLAWDKPRSVVLVLDCCFAGNVAQAAERRSIGDAIEQHFRGVTVSTGRLRAYLAATVPGEKAYEDDRGGWLRQRVVACLRDKDCSTDGMLTVPVLIDAVKKQHSAQDRKSTRLNSSHCA